MKKLKKKIAILFLVTFTLSGCGTPSESNEKETLSNLESVTEITEDNKVSDLEGTFSKVQTATNNAITLNSYNLKANMTINLKSDSADISNSQEYDINKCDDIYSFTTNMTSTSQMGEIDPMTQTNTMTGYYKDGVLYFDTKQGEETVNLKESMDATSFEELLKENYSIQQIDTSFIKNAAKQETSEGEEYLFDLNGESLSNYIKDSLSQSGITMDENSDISITKASLSANLDKEGRLVNYNLDVSADFTVSEQKTNFSISIQSTFSDFDNVKIEEKTDDELKAYIDANEYFGVESTTTEANK